MKTKVSLNYANKSYVEYFKNYLDGVQQDLKKISLKLSTIPDDAKLILELQRGKVEDILDDIKALRLDIYRDELEYRKEVINTKRK